MKKYKLLSVSYDLQNVQCFVSIGWFDEREVVVKNEDGTESTKLEWEQTGGENIEISPDTGIIMSDLQKAVDAKLGARTNG